MNEHEDQEEEFVWSESETPYECFRMRHAKGGDCVAEHWCGFRLISSRVEPMMYAG